MTQENNQTYSEDPEVQQSYEKVQLKAKELWDLMAVSFTQINPTLFDLGCLAAAVLPRFYVSVPERHKLCMILISDLVNLDIVESKVKNGINPMNVIQKVRNQVIL